MRDVTIPRFNFLYENYYWDDELNEVVSIYQIKVLDEHKINNSSLLYHLSVKVHL